MNVLAINGSPKCKNSNTHSMISSLLKGFENNGDSVNEIMLGEKNINYCKGCYSCWIKTPGECIQNDDMSEIIEKVKLANLIVFGSPLYFNNITGNLKVFIDRLTSIGGNPHESKETSKEEMKYIMLSNCGFPIIEQFNPLSMWINNFCKLTKAELILEIYTTNGKEISSKTEDQKDSVKRYFEYLENCGLEIGKNGKASDALIKKSKMSVLDY